MPARRVAAAMLFSNGEPIINETTDMFKATKSCDYSKSKGVDYCVNKCMPQDIQDIINYYKTDTPKNKFHKAWCEKYIWSEAAQATREIKGTDLEENGIGKIDWWCAKAENQAKCEADKSKKRLLEAAPQAQNV